MREAFKGGFDMDETAQVLEHKVTVLAPEGLGFGHGSISGNLAEQPAVQDQLAEALESPRLLVAVDRDEQTGELFDDDGCGDGRGVRMTFKGRELLKRSLHRAKVFGGGATMALSTRIGLGLTQHADLENAFNDSIDALTAQGIDYGAHTADHLKHESDCGCGAIDNAPEIITSAVRYESNIRDVITGTLGVAYEGSDVALNEVFTNFRSEAEAIDGQSFSGKQVMAEIINDSKVVKELTGGHLERIVILNQKRDYTVDQTFVREATDGQAQAFAVDVWRAQDLAQRLYPTDEAAQRKAFIAELVYTLATAAVLTAGDLPVVVTEAAEL